MGGAVACRSGGGLARAVLVWAGLFGGPAPLSPQAEASGRPWKPVSAPGLAAGRRRREQGWGLGGWGLGAANGAPEARVSAGAGVVTGTLTLGVRRDSPARGGGATRGLCPPPNPCPYCVRGRIGVLAGRPGPIPEVGKLRLASGP